MLLFFKHFPILLLCPSGSKLKETSLLCLNCLCKGTGKLSHQDRQDRKSADSGKIGVLTQKPQLLPVPRASTWNFWALLHQVEWRIVTMET